MNKFKKWYKALVDDEPLDVVEQPKPVVGEVVPGEIILDAIQPSYQHEPSVTAQESMLREEEQAEVETYPAEGSLMAKCNELKPVDDSYLLEPGSVVPVPAPTEERVSVTADGIRVGNVEIRIDSEHVKIVAPEVGPVIITARLRAKTRR